LFVILAHITLDWTKLKKIISENKIEEPIYYSLKLLNMLYQNTVPDDFLNDLGVKEKTINKFYDKLGNELFWETPFFDRMFSVNKKVIEILKKEMS